MLEILSEIEKKVIIGTSARLFHGRGSSYKHFNHLIIDLYWPVLVLTTHLKEDDDEGKNKHLCLELLNAILTIQKFKSITAVILRSRKGKSYSYDLLWGETNESIITDALGIKFHVNLGKNQNTGLFLDMLEGWKWVQEHSHQLKVLNLFAYTCAFSLAALRGGARSVVNVDMNKSMLELGKKNHALNGSSSSPLGGSCVPVSFLSYDILKSSKKITQKGPFDLIIVDPPTYQPGSFIFKKDIQKILKKIPDWIRTGGQVFLCNNDPLMSMEDFKQIIMENEMFNHQKFEICWTKFLNDDYSGLKVILFSAL